MPKSNWRFFVALGLVAAVQVAIFGTGFLNQPSPEGYPSRPGAGLEACHYQQAADAAEAAAIAEENLPATASKTVALDAARKADETNRAKADAQYCEQKLHEASDLWAQWQAATAATNSARYAAAAYWWLVFDLSLLSLTLAAAFWAARAAQRAADIAQKSLTDSANNVAAEKIVRTKELEAAEAVASADRAWLHFTVLSSQGPDQVPKIAGGLYTAKVKFQIQNFGNTPAFLSSMLAEFYWSVPTKRADAPKNPHWTEPDSPDAVYFRPAGAPKVRFYEAGLEVRVVRMQKEWDGELEDTKTPELIVPAKAVLLGHIEYMWNWRGDVSSSEMFSTKKLLLCRLRYEDIRAFQRETSFYKSLDIMGGAQDIEDAAIRAKYNYRK